MREKKSAASSRAESFLSARADFTASIVQFVDICVVAYTVGHDISCPYPFASVHSARNGPLQKAGPTTKNKIAQQAAPLQIQERPPAGCRRYKMFDLSARSLSGRGKRVARDRARVSGRRRRRCCGRGYLRGEWRRRFDRR